ncbi:Protein-L-isoaspartate O-methyltransferase [Hibiscus syriacus]|uniref:Protein-L-isoaspartate O-methyltransferase n=1 Tax=Hibiscus syriacus TaxID=106335 RepID=A0A6A2ZAK1_HIBSY|nr:protein-L-isoaspartate O-methyltransferase 1-like isoform X2 [Hibiscus syriacus]KAE8688958.1 Protein-L-isoaspartate O-methyltransferase [Hibiscus syriacus]
MKVAEVMETIDRGLFVPDGTSAYVDSPMPIGLQCHHFRTTCACYLPSIIGGKFAARVNPTCQVSMAIKKRVGLRDSMAASSSSIPEEFRTGYLTACFAIMVVPRGRAVGVEHIPELVASSIQNIEKSAAAPLLKECSLSLHFGDGRQGWPECAPYDAIHVGAAAPEIPQPLLDQLKPGGRMVIPVGNMFQDLKVVDKALDGSISIRSETSVRHVPLTSRDAQLRGY